MEAVIPIVVQALGLIPALVQAGLEIVPLVKAIEKALTSGNPDPTADEWQAVNDLIAANTTKINTDPSPVA